MARKTKKITVDGIDKRDVGYYPTPPYIAQYLFEEMMRYNPEGTKVLDPAVGKCELVESFLSVGFNVDGYDIVEFPNQPQGLHFHHGDFIGEFTQRGNILKKNEYDFVIMNPPYNCHEHSYIAANKESLGMEFTIGTFNIYALFVDAIIDIAKDGCIIGCVVPDSILFTPAYERLRLKILRQCEFLQIILCPTNLFRDQGANVDTCILILRKGIRNSAGPTLVANRPPDVMTLKKILKTRDFEKVSKDKLILPINGKSKVFAINCPAEIRDLFSSSPRLGDLYECGGGVSTGNNDRYTSKQPRDGFTIPFFLNINSHFLSHPRAFLCNNYMEQSIGTRSFIVRHPEKICQEGIVCSGVGKRFYAAFLPASGITGVNTAIWPVKKDIFWLLAYLNSSLVSYLMKGIISRSHITTIGNVSSLPIPAFDNSVKKSLGRISKMVLTGKMDPLEVISKIDRIVYRSLSIPLSTRRIIARFCADIIHLV